MPLQATKYCNTCIYFKKLIYKNDSSAKQIVCSKMGFRLNTNEFIDRECQNYLSHEEVRISNKSW